MNFLCSSLDVSITPILVMDNVLNVSLSLSFNVKQTVLYSPPRNFVSTCQTLFLCHASPPFQYRVLYAVLVVVCVSCPRVHGDGVHKQRWSALDMHISFAS